MMEKISISTFQNKRGEHRVSLLFSRSFAGKLAVGDAEAVGHLLATLSEGFGSGDEGAGPDIPQLVDDPLAMLLEAVRIEHSP